MGLKPVTLTLCFLSLTSILPALAQGRLGRPEFFQEGQRLMEEEIQRLQRQQPQGTEHPSQLLTVDEGKLRWQKAIFREGGFSVWMPEGIQSQEKVVLDTPEGPISFAVFATHPQTLRFIAAYSEPLAPAQLEASQTLLSAVRDGIIARTNFKPAGEREISFQQHPGRALSLEGGQETIAFRIYAIDRRVYVLAASERATGGPAPDVASFFDSFRLLP